MLEHDRHYIQFSPEFINKYQDSYHFRDGNKIPISPKFTKERYSDDIEKDLCSELEKINCDYELYAWWKYDNDSIDRILFTRNGIKKIEEYKRYSLSIVLNGINIVI